MSRSHTQLGGLLGQAMEASRRGRLFHFIQDERSPAITVFSPTHRERNDEGDWYGEHAGKWLYATAKAAARSGDAALFRQLRRVADYLVEVQLPDGYLGTYAAPRRFMVRQPPKPLSWNGEPSLRTWDIWTHSYLVLGLLEAHRHFPNERWLAAACRIGDLCLRTLAEGGIDINELGNHHGMSATVLLDPAVELHLATGEPRYLELARRIVAQADANPALALLTRARAGVDAADIATGKAYQLIWNLVGLAKLHRATGDPDCRDAVQRLWHSIRDKHLTLGGGPWGGVAHRSREVFNAPGAFSPQGYVETCSTLAWLQLNRELLQITGEAVHAEEIERTAYNDLLGAMAPDGEDWCYYSFPNGKRVHTTYWRCCKSSGAMALEELQDVAYVVSDAGDVVTVNLYGPSTLVLGKLRLSQHTDYPASGKVQLRVIAPDAGVRFALRLRIPSWAEGATVSLDGQTLPAPQPGRYAEIAARPWQGEHVVTLDFPMAPRLHQRVNENIQESRAPDGSPVAQQVLHHAYVAVTRGPLVYATTLIDGFKTEETVRLPHELRELPASADDEDGAPGITMALGYRPDLTFHPYYRAGGRRDGAWRLTWLSLAPDAS
ncbi:MAG TPA: beta-L-arabinofuranosidase domain-containing protein [Roseateles sp.]|uniref:glycoside hydrolase family 127 protein n=1 Tax=Roseateles sp. TaxID=1971397 RepID=UPI002EDA3809